MCHHQGPHRCPVSGSQPVPWWGMKDMLCLGPLLSGWPTLLPMTMVSTGSALLLPGAISVFMTLMQPGSALILVAPFLTEGCADAQSRGWHLKTFWCLLVMVPPGPYIQKWTVLPLWAMMTSSLKMLPMTICRFVAFQQLESMWMSIAPCYYRGLWEPCVEPYLQPCADLWGTCLIGPTPHWAGVTCPLPHL